MAKKKKKVPKLTESEYIAYIASLRSNAALYGTDGEAFIPKTIKDDEKKKDY